MHGTGAVNCIRESWRQRYLTRVVVPALRLLGPQRVDRLARFLVESRPAPNDERERILTCRIGRALGVSDFPANSESSTESESARQIAALRRSNRLHYARFWAELPFVLVAARKGSLRSCLVNADSTLHQTDSSWLKIEQPTGHAYANANEDQSFKGSSAVLYASACFGNPVVAALALHELHGELTVVADFNHFPMTQFWRRYWEEIEGLRLIDRSRAVRELPEILESRGTVFVLADHFRPVGAGVAISWLGRARTAYRTLGILAARHGANVVPVVATRTDAAMQFELWLGRQTNATMGVDSTVRDVLGQLEARVSLAPDQYHWAAAG